MFTLGASEWPWIGMVSIKSRARRTNVPANRVTGRCEWFRCTLVGALPSAHSKQLDRLSEVEISHMRAGVSTEESIAIDDIADAKRAAGARFLFLFCASLVGWTEIEMCCTKISTFSSIGHARLL